MHLLQFACNQSQVSDGFVGIIEVVVTEVVKMPAAATCWELKNDERVLQIRLQLLISTSFSKKREVVRSEVRTLRSFQNQSLNKEMISVIPLVSTVLFQERYVKEVHT